MIDSHQAAARQTGLKTENPRIGCDCALIALGHLRAAMGEATQTDVVLMQAHSHAHGDKAKKGDGLAASAKRQ